MNNDEKIPKITKAIKDLADQLERLSSLGVSKETLNVIVSSITTILEQINLNDKVNNFEKYLRECSNVYNNRDHYTGDYAFAVDEVLLWYRKWFNIEQK